MGVGHRRSLLLLCLGIIVLTATVAGDSAYAISGTPSIETPTRNVSFEGQQYTIDSITRITADDSVTVTTDVPDDASYELNLRGPENQLIENERLTDDASYTFSYFGSGEAGTYAVTIQDGGDTVAVYPVVVSGYDVTVTTPESVEAGDEATITATVTPRDIERHSSLDSVQVVVGNDDVVAERTMEQTTGDEYEATVSTTGLAATEYNVYVVVRGNATVRERAEILGVSDTDALSVTSQATATATPEDDATGGEAPDQTTESPQTTTSTEPPTSTTTTDTPQSVSTTEDSPSSRTVTQTTAAPSTVDATTQSEPTRQSTETESSGVIDPATPQSTRTTTGGGGPGFTLVMALGALSSIGLWLQRRRE